jgi:hypothetical protein
MFGRFAIGLPGFLRSQIPPGVCPDILKQSLADRERSFLKLVEYAVYKNELSPYRKLLQAADVDCEDLIESVRRDGIEETLGRLFAAGVYLTLEEFKGRQPICRSGLELEVKASDFDNPLLVSHFEGSTGGSRGSGTRLIVDLDLIAGDALMHAVFLRAHKLESSPTALWRPLPPGVAGIKKAFMQAKLGRCTERWFSQNRYRLNRADLKYFTFLNYSVQMSRLCGVPIPAPEFVPVSQSERIAGWLAQKTTEGHPGHLDTNASCAVRVLQAASENGLDIAGSFFRVGGEPYTSAKAKMVAAAGCRGACHYSMAEVGPIGIACADGCELDDVHLGSHKVALLQKNVTTGVSEYGAFHLTTLSPRCPKIMLNVATGDYGVLQERECSCPFGRLGFHQHVHSIRSYEKLTSEGMQFLGSDLIFLLEQILPGRFGGGPHDYQFVEVEEAGRTRVQLIASKRLGPLDEKQLLDTAFEFLGSRAPENRMMVERWREGGTLVVRRSEPYVTKSSKLLPLHVLSGSDLSAR